MGRSFMLARPVGAGIVPSQGEDLGSFLAFQADDALKKQISINYNYDRIATLYELAADAYDMGAAASIGHNRTDRYMEQRRRCLEKAERCRQQLADHNARVEEERANRGKSL